MEIVRKVLGGFLISLPLIIFMVALIATEGLLQASIILGILLFIIGCIVGGVHLIADE